MEKSLIIVESPAKAKTISRYLGGEYIVHASVGHIKNLPKNNLGVDIEGGYLPTFETIEGKAEVIETLRKAAKKAEKVYIATDPDREGEAIAADIAGEVNGSKPDIYRVLFHEITERGINDAMKNPKKINDDLVASQRARRVMDRIVGYKVSPFVWKTLFYGLSAGRVQSVALRLICEREAEIDSFTTTPYWSIIGEFKTNLSVPFFTKLFRIGKKELIVPSRENLSEMEHKGTSGRYLYIRSEDEAEDLCRRVRSCSFKIASVQKRDIKRNPQPPFITSTLQQEASKKLRLSASRTMKLAQKLYEGVELGSHGSVGLITYMRTDSVRLSADAIASVREYIYNSYGKEYLPKHPYTYRKKKTSQDAHEAIRPTSVQFPPGAVKKYLDKDLHRVYELIWNRFVACQMEAAVVESTTVIVEGGEFEFKATSSQYKFRGFLQVYDDALNGDGEKTEEEDEEVKDEKLPLNLSEGQVSTLLGLVHHCHETSPPPRYSEASLVKTLEALGIGRPSTYAMIVSTIIDRKYVEQRERRLYALQLGIEVNKLLTTYFPHIFNVRFTAKMEEELDTIAAGKNTYKKVMDDFYAPFIDSLERASKKTTTIKKSLQQATDEKCDVCGKPMIIKWGRNGKFMACSGYPGCKSTKPLPEDQEKIQHATGQKCTLCGGDMMVRTSRFGTFLGCTKYPKCSNTKPISMGMKCPKCKEGEVIERKTKRKRIFYGCSRFPECDFASWDKPFDQACDTCASPFMVLKYSEKRGEYLKCPACKSEVVKPEASAVS